MENLPLKRLAERLNLTDLEPEPYILTKEEEGARIEFEIDRMQKQLAWKLAEIGYKEIQIMQRISETDWELEIDRDEILKQANSAKHQNLWHEEQRKIERESVQKRAEELRQRCDAKYMFNLMKWSSQNEYGKKLIVNDYNKHLITALCYFLSNDERFQTELGFDFRKGLLIRGISGLGKTHLVQCVSKNELNPVLILSMIEIADEVKHEGEYQINLGNNKIVYLDDVGTEEATVNHYGTKINFFKNFIEMVYLRNKDKTFGKLMISTNNSFAEIEEKYGFRVRSRMKDMFNIIDVQGKDMRG